MRAGEGEEYRGGAAADKIEIDSSDKCVQRYVDWLADRREGEGGRKHGCQWCKKVEGKEEREGREGRCVYLNAGPSMQPRRRLACESIIV